VRDTALEFIKAKQGSRAGWKNVVEANGNGDSGIDGRKYGMGLREAGQEEGENI